MGTERGLTWESMQLGSFDQAEQMYNEKKKKEKKNASKLKQYILSFLSTVGALSCVLSMYIQHDWILGWFKNKQNQLC